MVEVKERIQELVALIEYHNNLYYNEDTPEIEDHEYDKLTQELKKLEEEYPEYVVQNSPTQKVGGTTKAGRALIAHKNPMQSLRDVFSTDDVVAFVNKTNSIVKNPKYGVEQKIDGLSVSLRYEKGVFALGFTRGDGITNGEDVTANLKTITDIPHKLKEKIEFLEVRGEVYMTAQNFEAANEIQELNGDALFKNPRNCAAGTLRQLDASVCNERKLSMFAFNIQEIKGKQFSGHQEGLIWLQEQGFKTVPIYPLCDTMEEVLELIEKIKILRPTLPYGIDGAVVKVDNLNMREELGTTSKVPIWACAYKYPPEEKQTTIKDIIVQVGRTGRITPVAIFETIELAGTSVSRAVLHNQDRLDELNINVGDVVTVRKAADIIPEIINVVEKNSTGAFQIPSECPECSSKAVRKEGEADIRCENPACPAQFLRLLCHFASREAMHIEGLGPKNAKYLVEAGYIKTLSDIYYLNTQREKLIEENIIGKEKTVDNLLAQIEKSKTSDISRLIKGLGAKNIGKHVGKILQKEYGSIEKIKQLTYEELVSLDGIGDVIATTIIEFISAKSTVNMLNSMAKAGVNMESEVNVPDSNLFAGKTFVITGTLSQSRSVFEEVIEKNGGKKSGSVSKKTSYVLIGEDAGSKADKAAELGLKIINEDEFWEMLKI